MRPFGKRRQTPVNVVPDPAVIRYMWEQGIYLVVSNGLFFWVEPSRILLDGKASQT